MLLSLGQARGFAPAVQDSALSFRLNVNPASLPCWLLHESFSNLFFGRAEAPPCLACDGQPRPPHALPSSAYCRRSARGLLQAKQVCSRPSLEWPCRGALGLSQDVPFSSLCALDQRALQFHTHVLVQRRQAARKWDSAIFPQLFSMPPRCCAAAIKTSRTQ